MPHGEAAGRVYDPAGKIAMIGIGDRTNLNGASQVLRRGINFEEVAMIHQPAHPLIPGDEPDPMINMHLDTYLNFPGKRSEEHTSELRSPCNLVCRLLLEKKKKKKHKIYNIHKNSDENMSNSRVCNYRYAE